MFGECSSCGAGALCAPSSAEDAIYSSKGHVRWEFAFFADSYGLDASASRNAFSTVVACKICFCAVHVTWNYVSAVIEPPSAVQRPAVMWNQILLNALRDVSNKTCRNAVRDTDATQPCAAPLADDRSLTSGAGIGGNVSLSNNQVCFIVINLLVRGAQSTCIRRHPLK